MVRKSDIISSMSVSTRTASPEVSAVLEHVAAAKRRTVSLPADREWLAEITPHYARLLDRMAARKSLYRVLRGQYVVAPRATDGVDQAAAAELLVDLVLRGQGEYYLGFLSALIAHRLTDLHASTLYAAIRQDNPTDITTVSLAGRELRLVRLSPSRWPTEESERERERVRVQPGLKEFVWRSTLERTLVDGLLRPELCGGIETVITSWARATEHQQADWTTVWAIAKRTGAANARRTAYLLIHSGHEQVLAEDVPALNPKGAATPLDRSNGYGMTRKQATRDPRTGVLVNVPTEQLRGWFDPASLG
jgi:predicted transcriptional regulator of viral defense system